MKATQKQVLAAYVLLNNMSAKPLNSITAYKLYRVKKALKENVEFQIEEERRIAEEFGGEIAEDGRLNLPDGKSEEYASRHKELVDMECEIDAEKAEIHMSEFPTISLSDMETLEPFIDWRD